MPKKKEPTKDDYIKADIQDITETMLVLSKMEHGDDLLQTLAYIGNLLIESNNQETFAKMKRTIKHNRLSVTLEYGNLS